MSIHVGICGLGQFARHFIPLIKTHPEVGAVTLCDHDPIKLQDAVDRYQIDRTCPSLDLLCQTDVDAIALFTQNTFHGPQAVQALRSGKHVYSAVPSAITLAEIEALVKAVEETGNIYVIGETSYYYPATLYCRERFRKGDFGHVVYGEAEYYHDSDPSLYNVYRWRYGDDWKKQAGIPPMYYPTHSTSMIVSVTGAHATHVCGMGYVDRAGDGIFERGINMWDNEFSNETMLCRMSDGSSARINEFRRTSVDGVRMRLYGTEGSYEEQTVGNLWIGRNPADGTSSVTHLEDALSCAGIPAAEVEGKMATLKGDDIFHGVSKAHPVHLLPAQFANLPNGHRGSHQFLIHEFITACLSGETPPNNVWQAARYLVPGLVAHESAKLGGQLLEVPDFGDASS